MADTQYDLPEKVIKLYRLKNEMRKKSKAYFARYIANPHQQGHPFDPQQMRFSSARAYHYEFYKRTPASITFFFCALVLPVGAQIAMFCYTTNSNEKLFRSGEVAYKDRQWKKMY